MKDYHKNSNKGYIFEYLKYSHDLQSHLPFLPEGIKIEKFNKLVWTLYDKKQCCSHKSFKTNIKSWISF